MKKITRRQLAHRMRDFKTVKGAQKAFNEEYERLKSFSQPHTSPSRDESTLSQNLLRHLKGKMTFWQTESMREGLSCLRRGLTDAEFHELCDDLARDIVLYGDLAQPQTRPTKPK